MNQSIETLAPAPLWRQFAALTQIPRPSHHEAAVQEYVISVGRRLGLDVERDPVGNVIIRKAATPGMEGRAGVILQGHLDMVPQANAGSEHDFTRDPISAHIEGDWVTADATTLGADNGIGVAAMLAVLSADDLIHGPLEALFTCNEEDGMDGASGLQPGLLQGTILINTDSEEEGELCIGCAGGANVTGRLSYRMEVAGSGLKGFRLSVTGLKGGHSGVDIHLGRGNAIKLLFRLLRDAVARLDLRLVMLDAGNMRNAIPREAFARVAVAADKGAELAALVEQWGAIFSEELAVADPGLQLTLEADPEPLPGLIDKPTSQRVIDLVCATPCGVLRMSDSMPGLVESSSNLGIVQAMDGEVTIHNLVRSSVDSATEEICRNHLSLFRLAGATGRIDGEYPGWRPNPASPILEITRRAYQACFAREARIGAIHAGLECGILAGTYPGLDMISFGPTIRFPHSPDERVHIPSVARFWTLLTAVLAEVPPA